MTERKQPEELYKAKAKEGTELTAEDLEKVSGGNLELTIDTTALKSLKDILADSIG